MPIWIDCVQGSDEWLAARSGVLTASRVHDALAMLKSGKPSDSVRKTVVEIVTERLTGVPTPVFVNAAMKWGTETEPKAREAYASATGQDVVLAGLAYHDRIAGFGASPDGLVGDDGLIEIKCPASTSHVETLLAREIPEKHQTQMLAQLAVTGRQWCDFVSFDPRLPERYRLFVKRYAPSQDDVLALEKQVRNFLLSVEQMMEEIG